MLLAASTLIASPFFMVARALRWSCACLAALLCWRTWHKRVL
jgi:hypothetical protein